MVGRKVVVLADLKVDLSVVETVDSLVDSLVVDSVVLRVAEKADRMVVL